jgi:hypothetical protein
MRYDIDVAHSCRDCTRCFRSSEVGANLTATLQYPGARMTATYSVFLVRQSYQHNVMTDKS